MGKYVPPSLSWNGCDRPHVFGPATPKLECSFFYLLLKYKLLNNMKYPNYARFERNYYQNNFYLFINMSKDFFRCVFLLSSNSDA